MITALYTIHATNGEGGRSYSIGTTFECKEFPGMSATFRSMPGDRQLYAEGANRTDYSSNVTLEFREAARAAAECLVGTLEFEEQTQYGKIALK